MQPPPAGRRWKVAGSRESMVSDMARVEGNRGEGWAAADWLGLTYWIGAS
jgi:hypothetical protein